MLGYSAFKKIIMKNFRRNRNLIGIGLSFLLLLTFVGCERTPQKRQYTEIIIESEPPLNLASNEDPYAFLRGRMPQDDIHQGLMPQDDIHASLNRQDMQNMGLDSELNKSVDRTPLTWKTPSGWLEKTGSGMRLATFVNADANNPIEATIVSLGGEAGGVSANVIRWMQQINLKVSDSFQVEDFIKRQPQLKTTSNLPAVFIDFTELQQDEKPGVASMMAAVIERENAQIFVKMTGSKQAVTANREIFKSLVQSIRVSE